jgi:hypothetical protein
MKYIFTLITLFFLCSNSWAQSSSLSVYTYPNKSEASSFFGYVIKAGSGFGFAGVAGHKVFFEKLDWQKNVNWRRAWYDANNFFGYSNFIYCKDGGFVVASQTTFNKTLVFKIDASGNMVWNKVYTNSNTTFFVAPATTIAELGDGSVVLVNIINQNNQTFAGLLKIDGSNGNVLNWTVLANNHQTEIISIAPTKDSGFVLGGRYSSSEAYFTVIKFNKHEDIEWKNYYNTSNPTMSYKREVRAIKQTSDGGYISTAYGPSQENIATDVYVMKLSSTGQPQWTVKTGTLGDDAGVDVIETADSGYAVTSHSRNALGVAIKLNEAGRYVWSKILTPADARLWPAAIAPDSNNYLISGVYEGHLTGNNAIIWGAFLADVEGDGSYCANDNAFKGFSNVSTTSSDYDLRPNDLTSYISASNGSLVDTANDLVQVYICTSAANSKPVVSMASAQTNKSVIYPNPVNNMLNISFNQKQFTSNIQLSIIDVNGRTVITNKVTNSNDAHSINVSTLKPGLYILKISDGTNEEKLKFVKQDN